MKTESQIEQKEKTIDLEKRYLFPEKVSIIHYQNYILIIAEEQANWIVLENESQYIFFQLLKENTLNSALSLFQGTLEDAQKVIIQLEAREFENREVLPKSDEKSLHIHLTNSCNMRCPHCYMFAGEGNKDELETSEIFELLDDFKKCDGHHIVLSGGEICMRPDLFSIVEYAYALGLKIDLLTNGTLWTDSLISQIAPLITRVQISIDGFSEEKNALVRGAGNFKKSLHTVDRFIQHKAYTEIAITPLFDDQLEAEYQNYVCFANELMEKYRGSRFLVKFTMNILDGREIKFTSDEKNKYAEIIGKIYHECFGDILDRPFINLHKMMGIEDNCDYGNLTVTSDGNLFFCPSMTMYKPFGNLRTIEFEQVMKLSEQAKRYSNVNNLEPCKNCELKYICGGDCRIINFSEFVSTESEMFSQTPKRTCSQIVKGRIYDQMIRTNWKIFR